MQEFTHYRVSVFFQFLPSLSPVYLLALSHLKWMSVVVDSSLPNTSTNHQYTFPPLSCIFHMKSLKQHFLHSKPAKFRSKSSLTSPFITIYLYSDEKWEKINRLKCVAKNWNLKKNRYNFPQRHSLSWRSCFVCCCRRCRFLFSAYVNLHLDRSCFVWFYW